MLHSTAMNPVDLHHLFDLERREVSLRVLIDPHVYDLEMERIFGRGWLMLGHASEIPNKGDYVVRDMGDDKVVVVRNAHGEINVLLNVCAHRGMRVCTAEQGNAARLQCIYHGWVYGLDGAFIGAPVAAEQMHGNVRPKSELRLKQARVSLYGGFIFATWNSEGPSLNEWLGDYKFYTDTMFLRTIDGLEVLGPPQRTVLDVNWKIPGESFAGDGYHTLTLHRSMFEMASTGGEVETTENVAPSQDGVDVSANGHGMRLLSAYMYSPSKAKQIERAEVMERLRRAPPAAMTADMLPQLTHHLSWQQIDLLSRYSGMAGGMFPNVGFLWLHTDPRTGAPNSPGAMVVHTFTPRGPGRHEYLTWFLAEKCTAPQIKDNILQMGLRLMGSTGMIEVDDTDAWPQLQSAASGHRGRLESIKYHALLGERRPQDWPGGGKVYEGFSKDDTQWDWWLRWRQMMAASHS